LLGGDPLPMGTVGKDFSDYRQRLVALGISDEHILEIPELYSAQCSITTDQDNNQITAFHPGAMGEAHRNSVANANGVSLGIVAPDGKEAMIQHAHDFAAESIPFMFDPGQNLPLFSKDELMTFLDQATWCVMNDYESQLMMNTTGESINTLAQQVDALIVTRGGEGSVVYTDGDEIEIPTVNVDQAIDPTGCGDAYRAGLLLGLEKGWDWQTSGRVGSLIGAIKVQQEGTQNHQFSMEEFSRQYSLNFGLDLPT
jgi:adenosine kinase